MDTQHKVHIIYFILFYKMETEPFPELAVLFILQVLDLHSEVIKLPVNNEFHWWHILSPF